MWFSQGIPFFCATLVWWSIAVNNDPRRSIENIVAIINILVDGRVKNIGIHSSYHKLTINQISWFLLSVLETISSRWFQIPTFFSILKCRSLHGNSKTTDLITVLHKNIALVNNQNLIQNHHLVILRGGGCSQKNHQPMEFIFKIITCTYKSVRNYLPQILLKNNALLVDQAINRFMI